MFFDPLCLYKLSISKFFIFDLNMNVNKARVNESCWRKGGTRSEKNKAELVPDDLSRCLVLPLP